MWSNSDARSGLPAKSAKLRKLEQTVCRSCTHLSDEYGEYLALPQMEIHVEDASRRLLPSSDYAAIELCESRFDPRIIASSTSVSSSGELSLAEVHSAVCGRFGHRNNVIRHATRAVRTFSTRLNQEIWRVPLHRVTQSHSSHSFDFDLRPPTVHLLDNRSSNNECLG